MDRALIQRPPPWRGLVCILLSQGTPASTMDPSRGYDARLTRLERELAVVLERLRVLEGIPAAGLNVPPPAAPADTPPSPRSSDVPSGASTDMTGLATLLGRSFIVFGGAYLLRALTESGRLPNAAGILIGFTYALFWLALAWRNGRASRISAQFHCVTALLIGQPIVWEAT